jgi:uncharacterized membrane protein HdeD (DUF308 family)
MKHQHTDSENFSARRFNPGDAAAEGRPPAHSERPPLQPNKSTVSGGGMSAGLARNWWAVGLRGVAALLFGVSILILPPTTFAALTLLFASYIAADGVFAIVAGTRAAQRSERWWALVAEGMINLAVAGTVLVWPAMMVYPYTDLPGVWAIVTGVTMLVATRRLSVAHGRWFLAIAGAVSAIWGSLEITIGPPYGSRALGLWFVGYALFFGAVLLVLMARLRLRQGEDITARSELS